MDNTVDYSQRKPEPGVADMFPQRWSPRAFTPCVIPEAEQRILFDAARWAPSCFNEQPWRFITSSADSFDRFLGLLMDMNQVWAKNASLLGFLIAKQNFAKNNQPNPHARFDSGAAWMALNLQAHALGYHCHGMAGIHFDAVMRAFELNSEQDSVICGFAIGKLGDKSQLPGKYQEREVPSPRKALEEIWKLV